MSSQEQEVVLAIPLFPSTQEFVITPDDFNAGLLSLYMKLWKDTDYGKLERAAYSAILPFIDRYRVNTLKALAVISFVLILALGAHTVSDVLRGNDAQAGEPTLATDGLSLVVEEGSSDVQVVVGGVGGPPEFEGSAQSIHVVQQGENLFRISQRYGVSIDAVVQANGIPDASMIFIGQELIIPPTAAQTPTIDQSAQVAEVHSASPVEQAAFPEPPRMVTFDMLGKMVTSHHYCVNEGETLSQIAQRFNVTVQELVAWNSLPNPNYIQMGQFLVVVQLQ